MSDEMYVEISQPFRIHDSDIQTVLNEVKAAGAEAVSVNEQRVIATTAFGASARGDDKQHTNGVPVTIKAIGTGHSDERPDDVAARSGHLQTH
jgi:uncharacterized protein YlxW (UPF0749 family)